MRINEIADLKMNQISQRDLQNWLGEELNSLALDFGQKLEIEQARHIAMRLHETLLGPKFRNWEAGRIHAIFQSGLTGQYGKASRVTYQTLVSWIYQAERTMRGENVYTDEQKSYIARSNEHYNTVAKKCVPFIKYCQDRNIDITGLSQEEYSSIRDRFNAYGPDSVSEELSALPRYQNYGGFRV